MHSRACKLIFLTISAGAQKLNNNQHKKMGLFVNIRGGRPEIKAFLSNHGQSNGQVMCTDLYLSTPARIQTSTLSPDTPSYQGG